MRTFFSLIVLLASLHAFAQDRPVLTVYTYSSFTADWGPGPAIKRPFEAQCDCTLNFVSADDGVALLSRIRLEGAATKADVVLGLDTNLTAQAAATGLFAPHGVSGEGLAVPGGWRDELFLPFDYGYFAFVYRKSALPNPPSSMADLLAAPASQKVLIQDPRTSTPGLGLLLWMQKVYGDQAAQAWRQLQPKVLTVSKGWSEAYGLFLEGEAPLVLSYTTSPAYHLIAEHSNDYAAAAFSEGHYLQIEVAGRLKSASQPELADRFLRFMISDGFQQHIPTGNWMYPVVALDGGLPKGFETLVQPADSLSFTPEEVASNRKAWTQQWLQVLSK